MTPERPAAGCMVLYRWRLKAGREADFITAWRSATEILRREHGGLGSRLHRAHDGTFVAYAAWPDEATRAASGDGGAERARLRAIMRDAIEETFPEVRLTPVADLLAECRVTPASV